MLGQTIEEALERADMRPTLRYSFDMLGRARTAADAERYFGSYAHAIDAIGAKAGNIAPPIVPASRSISALHPRFEPLSRDLVLAELVPRTLELARKARGGSQLHRRRRGSRPARAHARR